MEEYLKKLRETIKEKKLTQFSVLPDLKTFKIIKKNEPEIVKIMKQNPEKYAGRDIAIITLQTSPGGFKTKKDIFSLSIYIYRINNDGTLSGDTRFISKLNILYREHELEKHPFKIKNLEKMIKWVHRRYIESDFLGLYYDEVEKKLEVLKSKINKKSSRSKSKKSKKY